MRPLWTRLQEARHRLGIPWEVIEAHDVAVRLLDEGSAVSDHR